MIKHTASDPLKAVYAALLLSVSACGGGGGPAAEDTFVGELCDSPEYGQVVDGKIVQYTSQAAAAAARDHCRIVLIGNTIE